jgi:acyl carrier protein
MTTTDEYVLDVLCKQLKELEGLELTPEQAAKTTLQTLGLDSLATLQIAMALEDALDMEIEAADLPQRLTIAEIARRLQSKVKPQIP